MLITSIVLAIFVISLGGILLILIRKIPVLNALPQNSVSDLKKNNIFSSIENKVRGILILIEKQIFWHKFLSWVKIMTLKIETRVDHLLHKIRKKAQEADKLRKKK